MSHPERIRKDLELLGGITPRYTLNVTGTTISLVARSGVVSSTKRYLFGENRQRTIEMIEKIVDNGIQLLQREIFVLQLLKKTKEGLDNLKKTYDNDDEIIKRLDNCILRIDNVCTRFERKLVYCIEQIPLLLEELSPGSVPDPTISVGIIQSHGMTPEKTPDKTPEKTPMKTPMKTPPPSPPLEEMVIDLLSSSENHDIVPDELGLIQSMTLSDSFISHLLEDRVNKPRDGPRSNLPASSSEIERIRDNFGYNNLPIIDRINQIIPPALCLRTLIPPNRAIHKIGGPNIGIRGIDPPQLPISRLNQDQKILPKYLDIPID